MHTVAVLALPDTIAFDLTTPVEVFGRVQLPSGKPGYRRAGVRNRARRVTAGPIPHRHRPRHRRPGRRGHRRRAGPHTTSPSPHPRDVLTALRRRHAGGVRIASICSGAFTLPTAGLLDGKRATTHWLAADLFRASFPAVHLDPDVLYVDEGQVLTSAGASAGLDLCLYMVHRDYGAAVAADAARLAIAPLHRSGGQAQFILRNQLRPSTLRSAPSWTTCCLDRAGGTSRPDVARHRRPRRGQRPHPQPPFSRRDRADADAMADRCAGPSCPAAARDHVLRRRANWTRGRVHLACQLPRAVSAAHRGAAAELPQHLSRSHRRLITASSAASPAPAGPAESASAPAPRPSASQLQPPAD